MGLLEDKRALITGGTTGLGLAIAGRFRREGARVVITGRDHDLGGRAEQALGPGVRFVAADAADPDAVASSVSAAADHLGGLDVLVNNVATQEPIEPTSHHHLSPRSCDVQEYTIDSQRPVKNSPSRSRHFQARDDRRANARALRIDHD